MDNSAIQEHEWVLDYGDYEAVLVCNNELPQWSTDSIIRAFQTYQFRDTSDNDDEIELTHIDGGAIVQYDGNVMAIRYSENFVLMLPDLVMALSSLGWKAASAYHNAESIALFMEDLGRSIPASVDFDVVPAGKDSNVTHYPLGHAMLSDTRGSGLNAKEQLNVLAQEFNSLDQPVRSDISALKPNSPIILLEDPAFDGMLLDTVTVNTSRLNKPQPFKTYEDEEPLVFQLPDQSNDELKAAQEPILVASQQKVISIDTAKKAPPSLINKPLNSNIIQLGKGYVLFDLPDNPLAETDIGTMLGEEFKDASQYVHLYPGKLNSPIHWNLLGEIPPDNPQFADTLVRFMNLSGHDRTLLSALLANVSTLSPKVGFRTVLSFIIQKCSSEGGPASFGFYEEKPSSTASDLIKYSDYTDTKTALMKYTGQLALIPDTKCILDINTSTDGNFCDFEEFTLRDLMKQETPWVYFIHCSKDDNILAKWISLLLYNLTKYLKDAGKAL